MTALASPLAGKTHREVVLGTRGAVHIAHPLAERALCGAPIGERPGIDAFGRKDVDGYNHCWPDMNPRPIDGYDACGQCQGQTYAGGGEERQAGAYA